MEQARCISALIGEKESTVFVVGTLSVQQDNEVHLFEVPDRGEPRRLGDHPFKHPKEIWDLAPSPTVSDLLFTTYRDPTAQEPLRFHSSLWKIEHYSGTLREMTKLEHSSSIKKCAIFFSFRCCCFTHKIFVGYVGIVRAHVLPL